MTPAKRRALGRQEVGTWWNPATPDDVRAEQKRADTARAALTASLVSSPPTGDPTQIDNAVRAWNALDAQVRAYALEDPSTFWWTRDDQVSRGIAFEVQIEANRQQFGRLGTAVPPAPAPPPASPTNPAGGLLATPLLGDAAEILKWGAIAFIAYELLGRR
jgi:hypothetical protein